MLLECVLYNMLSKQKPTSEATSHNDIFLCHKKIVHVVTRSQKNRGAKKRMGTAVLGLGLGLGRGRSWQKTLAFQLACDTNMKQNRHC